MAKQILREPVFEKDTPEALFTALVVASYKWPQHLRAAAGAHVQAFIAGQAALCERLRADLTALGCGRTTTRAVRNLIDQGKVASPQLADLARTLENTVPRKDE